MSPCRPWRRALALGALLAACDSEHPSLPHISASPPVSLENALLYIAEEGDDQRSALLLDVSSSAARVSTRSLPEGEVFPYPRPGQPGEALLLTGGRPASLEDGKGRDAVPSFLLLFDRGGERKRFELSARYGALAVSDDGRFAIAYAPGGAWSTADSIAVIDLDDGDTTEPVVSTTVRALDGQGPSAVAFAPATSPRRLAVLVMTDAINLLDLEHPERKDKVLPLKLPNGSSELRATKVLFTDDHCFVKSDRGSDILSVRFEDDGTQTFRASLSTLPTEGVVQDIALLAPAQLRGSTRLLALGQNSLRVIDATTGDGETSSTTVGFQLVRPFFGRSPFDDTPRQRALLWGPSSAQIGFVDLQEELPGAERSVEVLNLGAPAQKLELASSQLLAVVAQATGRVSIVDLEERTVSSLNAEGTPTQLVLDERADIARAWVLMSSGSLGSIDLTRRTPTELLLERAGTFILPIAGDQSRVAIGHHSLTGSVTLLDAARPARATSREIAGFVFSRSLD